MVISSLEEGANVNGGDVTHQNWTAVHYAAYYGHAAVIEVLIQSGADVNAADVMKWTPLHYAALKGRYDACLALLNCGANTSALTEVLPMTLNPEPYTLHPKSWTLGPKP
jgi:ankyrin repeat protein